MEQHGLSQTELAKKAGVSIAHLNKVLNGKFRLGISTARALASAFGIDADDLYFGENLPQPSFSFSDAVELLQAFGTARPDLQRLVFDLLHSQDVEIVVDEFLREQASKAKAK